jgi:MFS family permease
MTGLAPSLATVITGRLFSGMLSAMPTCVATGSVENIWDSRARIWGIASWAAAGVFAMAIGPLYAVFVSDSRLGW